jgi:hypothetical protein
MLVANHAEASINRFTAAMTWGTFDGLTRFFFLEATRWSHAEAVVEICCVFTTNMSRHRPNLPESLQDNKAVGSVGKKPQNPYSHSHSIQN